MRRGFVLLLAVFLFTPLIGVAAVAAPLAEPVSMIGPWAADAPEGEAFLAELATVKRVSIEYELVDEADEIIARVTGADPPDIVVVSQPGLFAEFAGDLVPLTEFVPETRLRKDFGDYLVDQGSVGTAIVGAPVKADIKTLVWYRPDAFAAGGYAIPQTFAELVALSDQMVANGQTPWCHYMGSDGATGWVGTDWIEDLLLGSEGPTVYDQWVAHDVLFVDPRIETAFERYQQMIDTAGYVYERDRVLVDDFWFNAVPLYEGDCLMHRQATFFRVAFDIFGMDPSSFATFRFPSVNPAYGDATMGGGSYVAATADGTEVRSVMRYVLGHRFGREAIAPTAAATGWLLPNLRFDTDRYTDPQVQAWADQLHTAIESGMFRFDASDLMPPVVGFGTFWTGIVDLVSGAATIPEVLTAIDASWP
jgi:alpha-glucoside transport system substrate-binding protein